MSKLSDFLTERNTKIEENVIISDKIPFPFRIRPLTSDEFSRLQKECNKPLNKGKFEFDTMKFNEKVALSGCVDPDFKNADDVKKANCTTPSQFLKQSLLPGELSNLVEAITKLSGFDKDIEDLKDEVKNS